MYCTHCGAKVGSEQRYCVGCGETLTTDRAARGRSLSSTRGLLAGAACAGFGIVIAAIFVLGKEGPSPGGEYRLASETRITDGDDCLFIGNATLRLRVTGAASLSGSAEECTHLRDGGDLDRVNLTGGTYRLDGDILRVKVTMGDGTFELMGKLSDDAYRVERAVLDDGSEIEVSATLLKTAEFMPEESLDELAGRYRSDGAVLRTKEDFCIHVDSATLELDEQGIARYDHSAYGMACTGYDSREDEDYEQSGEFFVHADGSMRIEVGVFDFRGEVDGSPTLPLEVRIFGDPAGRMTFTRQFGASTSPTPVDTAVTTRRVPASGGHIQVEPGMNPTEVQNLMGSPRTRVSMSGSRERWTYYEYDESGLISERIYIFFTVLGDRKAVQRVVND